MVYLILHDPFVRATKKCHTPLGHCDFFQIKIRHLILPSGILLYRISAWRHHCQEYRIRTSKRRFP